MKNELHDLPIFLYVSVFSHNKIRYYEGDICWGRKPTKSENVKLVNAGILFPGEHFIMSVKNKMLDTYISKTKNQRVFSNLEDLISNAKELYIQNNFTTAMILSEDGRWKMENQIPEQVIIIGDKYSGTKENFLKYANENVIWKN